MFLKYKCDVTNLIKYFDIIIYYMKIQRVAYRLFLKNFKNGCEKGYQPLDALIEL